MFCCQMIHQGVVYLCRTIYQLCKAGKMPSEQEGIIMHTYSESLAHSHLLQGHVIHVKSCLFGWLQCIVCSMAELSAQTARRTE